MTDIRTSLQPLAARDIAQRSLQESGWTVTAVDHWVADVERGSVGTTAMLGPLASGAQHHVKFRMSVFAHPEGGTTIRVQRYVAGDLGKSGAKRAVAILEQCLDELRQQLPQ